MLERVRVVANWLAALATVAALAAAMFVSWTAPAEAQVYCQNWNGVGGAPVQCGSGGPQMTNTGTPAYYLGWQLNQTLFAQGTGQVLATPCTSAAAPTLTALANCLMPPAVPRVLTSGSADNVLTTDNGNQIVWGTATAGGIETLPASGSTGFPLGGSFNFIVKNAGTGTVTITTTGTLNGAGTSVNVAAGAAAWVISDVSAGNWWSYPWGTAVGTYASLGQNTFSGAASDGATQTISQPGTDYLVVNDSSISGNGAWWDLWGTGGNGTLCLASASSNLATHKNVLCANRTNTTQTNLASIAIGNNGDAPVVQLASAGLYDTANNTNSAAPGTNQPTIALVSGCTGGSLSPTQLGGVLAGGATMTYTGSCTGAFKFTLTFPNNAHSGWSCRGSDETPTTPVQILQYAHAAGIAYLEVANGFTAGDYLSWTCVGY